MKKCVIFFSTSLVVLSILSAIYLQRNMHGDVYFVRVFGVIAPIQREYVLITGNPSDELLFYGSGDKRIIMGTGKYSLTSFWGKGTLEDRPDCGLNTERGSINHLEFVSLFNDEQYALFIGDADSDFSLFIDVVCRLRKEDGK